MKNLPNLKKPQTFWDYLPWIVAGIGGLYLLWGVASAMIPRGQMRLEEAAGLPVVHRGREQPIDTVARTSLMIISGRQTTRDAKNNTVPAIRWLFDVITKNPAASDYKVFRIENDQVLALLGLEPRSGFRYSLSEIDQERIKDFDEQAHRIKAIDPKNRTLFEAKVMELAQHFDLFMQLSTLQSPYVVPPIQKGHDWQNIRQAAANAQAGDRNPAAIAFVNLLEAYRQGDAADFNAALKDYEKLLERELPRRMAASRTEVFFNAFEPFHRCCVLYIFVFILACVGWLTNSVALNRSAFWLAVVTLCVHSIGLLTRMYLMDRPFVVVTNLYSSAIFIGWGCVFLGLFLEWAFPVGIGNVTAALAGGLTLIVAHNLSLSGDTLEQLQAVLDTNFWLATHVTCITMGYTATFVAGILGILFVLKGVFTRQLTREAATETAKMIYGINCFAILFSFTGTVLGGIWADQSWGRFWGWDPKENGALIIVLWNALVLHARWAGMIKQRGLAVLSIGGNIVTAWSWFGVNMLGVGLHAYGFIPGAVLWMGIFLASQLAIIGLGMLPMKYWLSFKPQATAQLSAGQTAPLSKAREGHVMVLTK